MYITVSVNRIPANLPPMNVYDIKRTGFAREMKISKSANASDNFVLGPIFLKPRKLKDMFS